MANKKPSKKLEKMLGKAPFASHGNVQEDNVKEPLGRMLAEQKFRRASPRADERLDYQHPVDTRYKNAVDSSSSEAQSVETPARFSHDLSATPNLSQTPGTIKTSSSASTSSADDFFDVMGNPYEAAQIKKKAQAKAQKKKKDATELARKKKGAAKHLSAAPLSSAGKKESSQPQHAAPQPHALGYEAPLADPYATGSLQRAGDQTASGTQTVGFKGAFDSMKDSQPPLRPKRKLILRAVAIIVAAFVGVGILGFVAWTNRNVTFLLNGDETIARAGTPITQIMEDKKLTYRHGNLVSVSGNTLEEGKGNPFSLKLNDQDIPYDEAKNLEVFGEEAIVLGDGADVMEPYDSQTQEQEPTLTMQGAWGSVGYISQWPKIGKIEMRTGKISGETAPGTTLEPLQNAIITNKMITPANGEKLIALTFDDGPSQYTQQYLDILQKYQAHATFFELCDNISLYPDASRAIIASGNQIGSHTKTHSQLTKLPAEQLRSELTETFAKIKDTTDEDTSIVRPPYGDISEMVWLNSMGKMSLSALWTQDSEDWKQPGVDKIVSNALSGIGPGSIILMHDGGGKRDQDLQAFPIILQTLTDQGYKFVTLKDLLASDPTIPQEIAACTAQLPDGCTWPAAIGD